MAKKNKLPKFTFEEAVKIINPCSSNYNLEWWKKQFGRKKYITAKDMLTIPVREFKWGNEDETPTMNRLYGIWMLTPLNLNRVWEDWMDTHDEDTNTHKETKFVLKLFDRYLKGKI